MSFVNRFIPKNKPSLPFLSMVVLAAGSSNRMGYDKIMADLCGKPVIQWSLEVFQSSELVREIIIVARKESIAEISDIVATTGLSKVRCVVEGGKMRAESSYVGVFHCSEKAKLIGIHDGARPLVEADTLQLVAYGAKRHMACCPGITPTDTIKSVDKQSFVMETIDRDKSVCIQTPQIFDSTIIKGALTKAVENNWSITDDSSAVEQMGVPVYVSEGSPNNIKLTTPVDFYIAEKILKERKG